MGDKLAELQYLSLVNKVTTGACVAVGRRWAKPRRPPHFSLCGFPDALLLPQSWTTTWVWATRPWLSL